MRAVRFVALMFANCALPRATEALAQDLRSGWPGDWIGRSKPVPRNCRNVTLVAATHYED